MKSGMLAAQAVFSALNAAASESTSSSRQQPVDISSYQAAMEDSYVWDELRDSRNIRPGYAVDLFVALSSVPHDPALACIALPCPPCPALPRPPLPALPSPPCPARPALPTLLVLCLCLLCLGLLSVP